MIGCDCDVCRSGDPRDHRDRPSVLVSYPDPVERDEAGRALTRRVLIDTAPELRQQAIRHGLHRLDAVLYTHAHADHIFGLDDLRRFNAVMRRPIDLYAEAPTLGILRDTFWYIFEPARNVNRSWVAQLETHEVRPGQPFDLFGARWTPVRLMHGRLPILGFRVDVTVPEPSADSPPPLPPAEGPHHAPARTVSLAYCTDTSMIPDESYPALAGLDLLVLDALRHRPHDTHMNFAQAIEQVHRIRPAQTCFTHIAHDIAHADEDRNLPPGVRLAYDGLVVRLGDTSSGSGS